MFFLGFLLAYSELIFDHQFKLEIEPSSTPPTIIVDRDGNLYYTDYWESKVYKIAPNGQPILQFGRRGRGPGEYFKPSTIQLFQNDQILFIMESMGRIVSFKTGDGAFSKEVHKRFYGKLLFPYEGNKVLLVARHQDSKLVHVLDEQAKHVRSWFSSPFDPNEIRSSNDAGFLYRKTLFYQDGAYPELWEIKDGAETKTLWKLKPPKFYRKPPEKPLSRSLYFNKPKVAAYYAAFTQLDKALPFDNHRYLAISWRIHQPHEYSLDIYDLKTRKLLLRQEKVIGRLVATRGKALYFLEERETEPEEDEDLDEEVEHYIHVYRF